MKMKNVIRLIILTICIPAVTKAQFACSGVDRVDIYLNSKLTATANLATVPTIKINTKANTDTLVLHAYTNSDGLRNSTLDIKDSAGMLIGHVNGIGNTGYEAVYKYIIDLTSPDYPANGKLWISLNLLCERNIETGQVATVVYNSGK